MVQRKKNAFNNLDFNKVKTVYNIQNNYDNTSSPSQQNQPNFNPIEKLIEVFEKRDYLVAENRKLYEALLQAERDKNVLLTDKTVLLTKLLNNRKSTDT